MEHTEPIIDVSSAANVYCSLQEEEFVTDISSTKVCSSFVEEQPLVEVSKSSKYWTTVDTVRGCEDENSFVRFLPGRNSRKYERKEILLLEQIKEGGQGTIHKAQILEHKLGTDEYEPTDDVLIAKIYKGKNCGQWPEDVFGINAAFKNICQFYGYCLEEDTLWLLMTKYDCSLRDFIDKQMGKDNCKGRPFPDVVTLFLIIKIAIGMTFLHNNDVLHRDLKADNIFVLTHKDEKDDIPWAIHIGDFDVASNVIGTLFWRAPEILQALEDDIERPIFTPKADVYSYAMTCYEILTGGIPFEGVRASNYNVVLSGKRPELPSDLNPNMKDFICRCWHQDPDARPTFNEIILRLNELVTLCCPKLETPGLHEIINEAMVQLDLVDAESSLIELKALLQTLLVKYNQADFLLICCELVAAMEQFQSQFGLRSFKEHPLLPFWKWFDRLKLHDTIIWKMGEYLMAVALIKERNTIQALLSTIYATIGTEGVYKYTEDEESSSGILANDIGMNSRMVSMALFQEERKRRPPITSVERHRECFERILYRSEDAACVLCQREPTSPMFSDAGLYVDNGSLLTSLWKKIGALI